MEPEFETWIRNNPQHFELWKIWETKNGNQLINEIENAGGEVIFSPGRIAYDIIISK